MLLLKCSVVTALFFAAVGLNDQDQGTIRFRGGGSLDGKVVAESIEDGQKFVVIESRSGSVYKIPKRKISRIETKSPEALLYEEQLKRQSPKTTAQHWEMYKWCKEIGGRSKLKPFMKHHLKEIVRLDPSDDDAWRRLREVGEPYVKVDGVWVAEEQHFNALGYVKNGSRWSPQVLEKDKLEIANGKQEFDRRKIALKSWRRNFRRRRNADPADIRKSLFDIVDSQVVGFFAKEYLASEKSDDLRVLYIEAIGQTASRAAQGILVEYAIKDPVFEIREAATQQLEQPGFSADSSAKLASRYLRSKNNDTINRAGNLIGRLGSNEGIVPLIGSLITQHKIAGEDPGRINTSFGNGGTGFSTGGAPARNVLVNNEGVRQALVDISGKDFGFEIERWQQWYVAEHTLTDYHIRTETDR